jgi:hypothetical protein
MPLKAAKGDQYEKDYGSVACDGDGIRFRFLQRQKQR